VSQSSQGNRETILVVEDEPAILMLVRSILEGAGFRVLAARSANEARLVAEGFPRTIHLLLTDVIMPGGSGPELATHLKEQRPDMGVILMSGHADRGILGQNHDWYFLKKPFLSSALLILSNDVLRFTPRPSAAWPCSRSSSRLSPARCVANVSQKRLFGGESDGHFVC
jgi:two-component system, cell cycle sensor histidine kinase and response regulator CckA